MTIGTFLIILLVIALAYGGLGGGRYYGAGPYVGGGGLGLILVIVLILVLLGRF